VRPRSNTAHDLFPQKRKRLQNAQTGERPRPLSRVSQDRDWTSLLGSLPHAIASCAEEARILPTVAWCVVPAVADGFIVDRMEGTKIRQEHAHHSSRAIANALYEARAPRPLAEESVVAGVLRGEPSVITDDGHGMVVALPTLGARRVITFLSGNKFTDVDLTQAEVFAQWLAFALTMRAAPPVPPISTSLASAVHDLMNPLMVISTNARGLREATDIDVRLSMIERSAQRMHRIATDALEQIRGATDRISIELCWTYTGDLFEEAAGAVRDAATARGIAIDVRDDDGLVVCDRSRVVQVLVNLLENAVKFTHRGGLITLSAARVEDHVRIRVTDNGRGIAEADLPRLFDRYWRNSGGTGIGLATARALVAAHDSELQVTSTLGSGSTFWFDLHSAD
jgi:signal transduction histidine kinase